MERIEFIISEFQKCNIELSQDKADKLLKLYEFLVEYNQNVNLTAITDFEEVVVKHFIDSVLPFSMIDIKENSSFIDVGTGAGFPSIPLMIVRPDLKGTLLEALNKRCVFLEKACELTEVDAKVIHGRAEDYAKEKREAFDFATARAVAAMPVLCEYCIPYVKTGGRFIALKSVNEDETLCEKAVKVLGGKIAEIKDYTITNGDNRRLFIIDKVSQTPTKYPRNPSMIKKKPL
ncbi:16S rRNA methyltransferase GidB [[Eubacterium] siraeum DSM 15702]|uniref:Ribosomal RNA small subunit methyltransferase G n=1 Tax=[Eubacterium] siraeum DSM 15702 TaxID=428128 RepID=B0MRF3_9FIRM|nr:16S rRNA methyltransferase GidB [[Eubacterium] siraeum DSM 15702]UWP25267.1 16S rRNA (guanine(527)-N(7))-methyltransferase RsmG [[Eubacterium] siraeum]